MILTKETTENNVYEIIATFEKHIIYLIDNFWFELKFQKK